MYEDYKQRAKTTNYIKINPNNYVPQKHQRFRDLYINQSPTFYNQYRYEIDNQMPKMPHVHYIYRQKRPFEYYDEERFENYNNSLKNLKSNNDYYFKDFNYTKNSGERNILQRSVNTMTNQNPRKFNELYYLENKNIKY